jgi:hypothetical protein
MTASKGRIIMSRWLATLLLGIGLVLTSCASTNEVAALKSRIELLELRVSDLEFEASTLRDSLDNAVSITDIQQAMSTRLLTVPAESIDKPFFCGGRVAVWNLFGRGLTCSGQFGE